MEKITILGMGHQGLAMAAHLSNNGVKCFLWNRTEKNIKAIKDSMTINCHGVLEKKVKIHYISTNIEDVLQKNIMITAPSSAHRDLARAIAPYVDNTYTVILNPGRTFGILDFANTLMEAGCKSLPCLAETQTIIYTCRRESEQDVRIFALKKNIEISTLKMEDISRVIHAIPKCVRDHFIPVKSYVYTSLGNVGMILHCAPVLMNIGWIENKVFEFEYYYDGISESIASVLERIDNERVCVANVMGFEIESLKEWLKRVYKVDGESLYELLQNNTYYRGIDAPKSINHRYIEEDVPNGLVALESAGKYYNISTPATTTIIDMACLVMNCDYRRVGRQYTKLKEVEKLLL